MFGVLVDVSGSMRSAYAVDQSRDTTVSRSHAIFTTILNIVKKECNWEAEIFAGAFGVALGSVTTCDLFGLLKKATNVPKELQGLKPGVEAMVHIAQSEGYHGTVDWIKRELSEEMAKDLFRLMCIKPSIKRELLEKLPYNVTATVAQNIHSHVSLVTFAFLLAGVDIYTYYNKWKQNRVRNSEAYRCAEDLVSRKRGVMEEVVSDIQIPIPQSAPRVVELFQELNLDEDDPSRGSSDSVRKNIDETLDYIEPYIYGGTPMVKAMRDALGIFQNFKRANPSKQMVLLILTDGQSKDGNPKVLADQIKQLGVTIVTCFLTDQHLDDPYRCYDDSENSSPLSPVLLEMSSTKHNNDSPMYYLADAGWKLPLSGESRLYIEANTLDIVNEVCEKVISELSNPVRDGVTDILNVVGVQDMIGESLENFEPEDQENNSTCYAHAVAAVLCFAMHRVLERQGGHPEFRTVREELIQEFGSRGANVFQVLNKVCPGYRLRFRKMDESEARGALNYRRPLVTTFNYSKKQRKEFINFYGKNSGGILQKENLQDDSAELIGHAVVLIKAYPNCLKFANSWGSSFGDEGFFKIKDSSVLSDMTFFDIYWDEDDLSKEEKKQYRQAANKRLLELSDEYKSLKDLPFQCPNCEGVYKMYEFSGNHERATCPNEQCSNRKFKPNYQDLGKTLYLRDCRKR